MNKQDLRIVFMGTPEFAVESLRRLVEGGYHVVAVVTQPDKPVGRHQDTLQPSEVKKYALSQGLPVLQPDKMKDPSFIESLRSYHADLQVVVAFRMLPEVVWAMPVYGTFNVHAALLPQYRGAAPINWAVINGEKETGVTTFFLDHQIDTGRIILQKKFAIPVDADVEYVYDGLMHLGAEACLETIDMMLAKDGSVPSMDQDAFLKVQSMDNAELKTAPKIFKDTCRICWKQPARSIYNFIRGLSPYPGAWCEISDCDRTTVLKIQKAALTGLKATDLPGGITTERNRLFVSTADEQLEILELQLSGKKRMNAKDFLNGNRNIENNHLR